MSDRDFLDYKAGELDPDLLLKRKGEATMAIGLEHGHVVVKFQKPIQFMILKRDEAQKLSEILADYARKLGAPMLVLPKH